MVEIVSLLYITLQTVDFSLRPRSFNVKGIALLKYRQSRPIAIFNIKKI